jgi:hypothetical protein
MTTLTIRLPDTLKGDLDKLSRRENKPVSDEDVFQGLSLAAGSARACSNFSRTTAW